MRWAELTSRQFANISRESVCVLPIGATEQHGPHLPVATDYLIAMAIAERLDDACGGKLLVMPGVNVTCSAHHLAFPGTLSIEHNSFLNVVTQIVESAAKHGFRRLFLLNAHGGNMAIGGVVAEQLSAKLPACEVVFTTWFRAAAQQLRPLVEGEFPAVGHACEFETSIIMAIRPELVDRDAIADDGIAPKSELLHADLLSGGPAVLSLPFDKITKNGAWGKPSLASAEKGAAILNIVIPALKELLAAYWPGAPGVACDEKRVAGDAAWRGAVVRNSQ
jgi:creatinine amidohydrolase